MRAKIRTHQQGRVNVGQTCYFTLYLVGGSSTGTLNGQKRKESSGSNSLSAKQFWKFPKILT